MADFSHPIELLETCHDRIRQFCLLLEKLPPHLTERGADTIAQEAAARIIRYFETAAVLHHTDETEFVFPALLTIKLPENIQSLIKQLTEEHLDLEAQWNVLSKWLNQIQLGKNEAIPDQALADFILAYRTHADLEERHLFGLAKELPDIVQTQLGQKMAEKRGVSFATKHNEFDKK